ncbi:MAG: hypothetical protein JWM87_4183 [Candidatus Eremiobacteraeota bacterium]|nr:hypothetical protein [Candidatus Eremiobacteraeota bacterium]
MRDDVSPGFRRVLARELPGWQADGVIGDAASQALVQRYELDRIDEPQRGWATSAFALLGAVAVGAGIFSFVAANWSALDSAERFVLVVGATIAAYGAAFALRARGRRALSEAAFVAAALGFGGSIALGAQQFNVSLDVWLVYALWAAGLVPLALALRNVSVSTVALAVGAISLATHAFAVAIQNEGTNTALVVHVVIVAVLATLLSWRLATPWFRELALAVVALGFVLAVVPSPFASRTDAIGVIAALVLVAGAARSHQLRTAGILLAFVVATPSTFWFAYHDTMESLTAGGSLEPVAILLLAAAVAAVFILHRRPVLALLPPSIAVALVILLPHVAGIPPLAGVLLANALILVPAVILIARGVALRDRTAFLYGTAVCAIAGFLRFAEYDHNLTTKAAAFIVVGLAFIGAALLFERERPDREPAHAA